MKKKDLLKQVLDYGIYAVVLYFVFGTANYCMSMEQACSGYDSTYWKTNNITLVICDCDCNPNISKVNDTSYRWPNPEYYPYIYSIQAFPNWIPNEYFRIWGTEMIDDMERWEKEHG